jgi:hypothetical protein
MEVGQHYSPTNPYKGIFHGYNDDYDGDYIMGIY